MRAEPWRVLLPTIVSCRVGHGKAPQATMAAVISSCDAFSWKAGGSTCSARQAGVTPGLCNLERLTHDPVPLHAQWAA
jgi:hypothetical protein